MKGENTMNNKELIKAWGNDAKRKSFLGDYKTWEVWVKVPKLKMVFYRYNLPGEKAIIAMEHMKQDYDVKDDTLKWGKSVTYLEKQDKDPFSPNLRISIYYAADLLKNAKMELILKSRKDTGENP